VIPPDVTWEVVVVNNGCTDDTDSVIASFEWRLPIRRAFEPSVGTSNARNRALHESSGEYVLWMDDDILVTSHWLESYVRAFRRWPNADVFGGPIEPLFEGEPPAWIPRVLHEIGPVFGRQTLGNAPVALAPDRVSDGPYGGNFVLRRRALPERPFSGLLGPIGSRYALGEETEVVRRLLASGLSGWWTPEPLVRHWIPQSSQTLDYVRRWMVACGQYEFTRSPSRSLLRLHYYWEYFRWIGHETSFRLTRHVAPPEFWIRELASASKARGAILAHRMSTFDDQLTL
jgi:glycosyltransferase involved in cell wall biosynthesis